MTDKLTDYIVNAPVHTKIDDIRKNINDMPKEKLIERIQATTMELVKLQYLMREYGVLEWYDKLNDRQKVLHNVFEQNIDRFKKESCDKNWIVLCDKDFEVNKHIKNKHRLDDKDIWYGFISNSKKVEQTTRDYSTLKLEGMLYTPLFNVSK